MASKWRLAISQLFFSSFTPTGGVGVEGIHFFYFVSSFNSLVKKKPYPLPQSGKRGVGLFFLQKKNQWPYTFLLKTSFRGSSANHPKWRKGRYTRVAGNRSFCRLKSFLLYLSFAISPLPLKYIWLPLIIFFVATLKSVSGKPD